MIYGTEHLRELLFCTMLLLKLGQSSVILNDTPGILKNGDEKIKYINDDLYNKFLSNFYVLTEKILKTFFFLRQERLLR